MSDAVSSLDAHTKLPSPEDLFLFMEGLRHQGYRIDARQIAGAERLLLDAYFNGPGSSAARQLKFRLAPLIATTPQEQEDFYRQFDRWRCWPINQFDRLPITPTLTLPRRPLRPAVEGRGLMIAGAVAAAGIGLGMGWYFWPTLLALLQTAQVSLPSSIQFYAKPAIAAVPGIAFALWLYFRSEKWRERLSYDIAVRDAELCTSHLPANLSSAFFAGRDFSNSAQKLRKHDHRLTRKLDVRKTVNATAARAGLLSAVYQKQVHLPEYVFLVEQKSVHDHATRLFDLAIERLRSEGVFIQRYYFHTDPRQLLEEDARTWISLSDLIARTNDRRLIVIATADGFFDPLRGDVESWVYLLHSWQFRTILIIRPLEQWTTTELQLLEEGFSLAPAEAVGFAAAAQKFGTASDGAELLEGVIVTRAASQLPEPRSKTIDDIRDLSVFRDVQAAWCPAMVALPTNGNRFAIGRYPVTFEEYDHFCSATHRKKPDDAGWGRGLRPVINVSWHDAESYAKWLAHETQQPYRLPRESEWEYAARSGSVFKILREWSGTLSKMVYRVERWSAIDNTLEVGTCPPNSWGLYDMGGGNVWEWVEADTPFEWIDFKSPSEIEVVYDPTYVPWNPQRSLIYGYGTAVANAVEGTSRSCTHVLRGGSWRSKSRGVRSAIRGSDVPPGGNIDIGFRVARNLDASGNLSLSLN